MDILANIGAIATLEAIATLGAIDTLGNMSTHVLRKRISTKGLALFR